MNRISQSEELKTGCCSVCGKPLEDSFVCHQFEILRPTVITVGKDVVNFGLQPHVKQQYYHFNCWFLYEKEIRDGINFLNEKANEANSGKKRWGKN